MKSLTQRQFINVLLIIALLLLSGCIFLAYNQVQQLKAANAWVVHTYEVLGQTNKTHLSLSESESLVNDYLNLEDNKLISLFNLKIVDVNQDLNKLQQLTTNNPDQQKKIANLRGLIDQKIKLLQSALTNSASLDLKPARVTFTNSLRNINAKIDEMISDIQESELVLLGVRGSALRYNAGRTNLILLITGILGNALLLWSFVMLNYYLSQRNYAEQAKQKLESNLKRIIDSSRDLIAAVDPEFRFTAFNNAYQQKLSQLFGKEIYLGMHLHDALPHSLEGDMMLETWERALNGEAFTIVHQLDDSTTSEDEGQYYETTYNSIYDVEGNLIGACSIMRDVTARRKSEQIKNEFISVVSHELRAPIKSIRESLKLIIGGAIGDLDDKTKNTLTLAYDNCGHLVKLINDILDIENIESGKLTFHFETLNVNQLVDEAIAANHVHAQKASVNLQSKLTSEPLFVHADHDRIIQVLKNLITNAIKFSKTNSEILVTVEAINNMARISVINHGKGMSEEFQQYIFQTFSETDSSIIRKEGGIGLGLSISKAIIERHNGFIGVKTQKDDSSIFYFDLPLARENSSSDHSHSLSENKSSNIQNLPRILYVEDNLDLSTIIGSVLHDKVHVDCVKSKHEALRFLKEEKFDLVLLDLNLPDGSGIDLLPEIKRLGIPVVVFSSDELDEEYLHEIDFSLVKTKTTNKELIDTIRKALGIDV